MLGAPQEHPAPTRDPHLRAATSWGRHNPVPGVLDLAPKWLLRSIRLLAVSAPTRPPGVTVSVIPRGALDDEVAGVGDQLGIAESSCRRHHDWFGA